MKSFSSNQKILYILIIINIILIALTYSNPNISGIIWVVIFAGNFLFLVLGFPHVTHLTKMKWSTWQLKVDEGSFQVGDYLSSLGPNNYLWNGYQSTIQVNEPFWNNEALLYIKPGDRIILWVHGELTGIYALGEVSSHPYSSNPPNSILPFYKKPLNPTEKTTNIPVKIICNLVSHPITHIETRKLRISEYQHPLFGSAYNTDLPKKLSIKDLNSDSNFYRYTEYILDEYGAEPFLPVKKNVWEKILVYINEAGYSSSMNHTGGRSSDSGS